jgi:hypothetical protein
MNTRIGTLVLVALLLVLTGCGGGGRTNPAIEVSISPSTANLSQGGTQPFTAIVNGTSNTSVNWTVQEGAAGGSINNMGSYTAPNKGGTFHVVATSQADTTKSATATVIVAPVAISLNQTAVTLDVGNQFMFVANVTGTANMAVSWVLQEGASGGNITGSGLYTAPATDGVFHVIATSQADTTQKQTATVTVATLMVSIFPPSGGVLGPLGVRDFTATVNTSLNANVTWSVQEGAAGGAITASGQYTAPNITGGAFHVVATSVQDPSKSAIADVTIVSSGFRPTGDMSTGRTAHTATLLPNGKVLVAGGDACFFISYYEDCPLNTAEVYDSSSGTFSATGTMLVKRFFHTATLLTSGKVLVTGGPDASAELYDPTSGTFAATGSMSVGRSSHTATLLANGKVLIAGGQATSGALATAELYDPNSGTFTATGMMAAARTSHTATLLANGKVLIAGGSNSTGDLATAELYDPITGNFTATNSMASIRAFHVATLLSTGNVLVTGGIANTVSLASAEVYDAVAGSFSATGSMVTARDSHFAVLLATNGNVLVAGGSSGSFTAELYNTGSGTFSETGGMETGRALAAAVLLPLPDGRVFVSGGSDTISAELYK